MVEGSESKNLLWNIERIITMIFIPILNANCMADKGNQLAFKVKKELLPCLRSFTRSATDNSYMQESYHRFVLFYTPVLFGLLRPSGVKVC